MWAAVRKLVGGEQGMRLRLVIIRCVLETRKTANVGELYKGKMGN